MSIKQRIGGLIVGAITVFALVAAPIAAPSVYAAPIDELKKGATSTGGDAKPLEKYIGDIVNIIVFIIGAISVLMIVIGGLRYVTSGGDSSSVTSAKNTILYAIVGLVVAIMAYAIVNFVLKALT